MVEPAVEGYVLSPEQEAGWLALEGQPGVVQVAVTLASSGGGHDGGSADGACPLAAGMAAILTEEQARHEILRTGFVSREGLRFPLQQVLPPAAVEVACSVLSVAPDAGTAVDDACAAERLALLDGKGAGGGASGPRRGWSARLVHTPGGTHTLVLTASSLVADVATLLRLAERVAAAGAPGAGEPPTDEPLQYADYAEWSRQVAADQGADAGRAREAWAEVPPVRHPATSGGMPSAHCVSALVPPATCAGLDALASRLGHPVESVYLTTWALLLAWRAGADDSTLDVAFDAREHPDIAGALGPMSRWLPVTVTTAPAVSATDAVPPAAEQLTRARRDLLWLEPRVPSADAGFAWYGHQVPRAGGAPAIRVVSDPSGRTRAAGTDAGRCRLTLRVLRDRDGAALEVAATGPGEAPTWLTRLTAQLVTLLDHWAAHPDAPLRARHAEPLEARRAAHEELNHRTLQRAPLPPATVVDLLAEQVRQRPQSVAVVASDGRRTYAELDRRRAQLAARLRSAGAGPGDVVGVCTGRTTDAVAAILAVLSTGAAYLPLNPEHPPARLAAQLGSAGCRLSLADASGAERVGGATAVLPLDTAPADAEPPPAEGGWLPDPGDPAYVLFTSGSTGRPKGVVVTHRSIADYARHLLGDALGHEPGREERWSFASVSALSTDLGHTAIFPALVSGGTLHLIDQDTAVDAEAFADYLAKEPVDVVKITPSHLAALLAASDHPGAVLPARVLITGGEALPWPLALTVLEQGRCRLVNHYGPTETTVGCASHEVAPDGPPGASVPIGRPLGAALLHVVDDEGEPLPVGVPGELWVGGTVLAQGYLGEPELTAQRFVSADRIVPAGRAYRTGDRVLLDEQRRLVFLGRLDDQVKIRGHRVEPGETAAVLREHPAVGAAAVVVDSHPEPHLVGFVVTTLPSVAELARTLEARLPAHQLPDRIIRVDALPLGPAGKLDRAALLDLARRVPAVTAAVPPRTSTEHAVARLWGEVLGQSEPGVIDDFFTSGGHSLLATQLVARIASQLGVRLGLRFFLEHPTIAALAAEVDARDGVSGATRGSQGVDGAGGSGEPDDDDYADLLAEVAAMSPAEVARALEQERSD